MIRIILKKIRDIGDYSAGFTLIEVLIVVSIMALLSGFLIVYTRGSENQIKILKDKAAFLGVIYRARSLALRTLQSVPPECGYGIYILNDRQYVLWRDTATKADCVDANKSYDSGAEQAEQIISLSPGLKFINLGNSDAMKSILFIPPDPTVVLEPEIVSGETVKIRIGTLDETSISEIKVNKYGQIETGIGY